MLVYRIEDSDGDGMYCGARSHLNPATFNAMRHPLPTEDSKLVERIKAIHVHDIFEFIKFNGYVFGFASQDQLRNWLYHDDWLLQLEHHGFRLSVFEIDDDNVIVGNTQAIFKRKDAVQTSYFGPADFFGLTEYSFNNE